MKINLSLILLLLFPIYGFTTDYYYYYGERMELDARGDKIAFMINNNNFSEDFVKNRVKRFLTPGDAIIKSLPDIYLIDFASTKSSDEIDNYLDNIKNDKIIKMVTRVYYGSSRKIIEVPTDRFIVRLRNTNDRDRFNILNIENNCSIIGNVSNENCFLLKSNSTVSSNALELSEIYYSSGLFDYAEPDFLFPEKCLLLSVPNDPFFQAQWSLNNTGQLLQTGSWSLFQGDMATVNGIPGSDMNVLKAWDYTTGSPNIKIGIIDTGIDSLHPDLQAPGHLMCGYDAFNDINSSAVDNGYHGTSTAGLAGAVTNNLKGISGIAPTCKLMSIAIFDINGNTNTSTIARAFDTARVRGIDVLSNSWGGGSPEATITNAINNAAINGRGGLGCVILFGSGNDGRNPPIYPSTLPNVLSVGASTPHDQKKAPGTGNQFFWGSNYGEDANGDLDLTAPTNCYTLTAGGGYDPNFYGTSATTPNAAGVAALVLSVNETQSRLQVYENLMRGCDKVDNVQYSVNKSFGKWNTYYGYGRVNALNSVRLASGIDITPPTINHQNISSHQSTYPTLIKAEITDQDGGAVPSSGNNIPKLFYRINKNILGWSSFDSVSAGSVTGNYFNFYIPSQGWETEVQYYIRATDNSGNETTFPKHAPNPFWLCYYAVGSITVDVKKIPSFSGADFGATISPPVYYGNFKILHAKFRIYMRHTYLNDEVIQIFSPLTDANNNRKCLFSSNGDDMDNITGASVSDSSTMSWSNDLPPYLNGNYMPEFTMSGFNGQNAIGNWRILHFDRGIGDYAFFDSVKIYLCKTTGIPSSSVRLNNPGDSLIYFDSVSFPGIYDKNFYLKNSGTSNLTLTGYNFSGTFSSMYSIINTPPVTILPNDSGLFKVRLNTGAGTLSDDPLDSISGALLSIQTNDPSKGTFMVSLLTNEPLQYGLKNLNLKAYIEGLYDASLNTEISDTLRVYLRNINSPYSLVDSSRNIIDANGSGNFSFSNAQNGINYYIIINHRNALETWSSAGKSFNASLMYYDFTTDSTKAYGNNLALNGTKYCLFSGDVNRDGNINLTDISDVFNLSNIFSQGYLPEDLDGDNQVNLIDIILVFNNSAKFVSLLRP